MFLNKYYLHTNVLNSISRRATSVLLPSLYLKTAEYPVLMSSVTPGKPFNALSLTLLICKMRTILEATA